MVVIYTEDIGTESLDMRGSVCFLLLSREHSGDKEDQPMDIFFDRRNGKARTKSKARNELSTNRGIRITLHWIQCNRPVSNAAPQTGYQPLTKGNATLLLSCTIGQPLKGCLWVQVHVKWNFEVRVPL